MMASGMALLGLAQARFRVHRRPNLVTLEAQHPGERLRHALIVVDDQDLGCIRAPCSAIGCLSAREFYCNRRRQIATWNDKAMLHFGFGEPDPRPTCSRTARARPHHPPSSGQKPASVRGRHQPRIRAERAGQQRHLDGISRSGAGFARARQAPSGGRGGRDRRVGQSSRGAGRMGAFRQASGGISPVRAVGDGGRRPPAVRRQPDSRE